MEVIVDDTQLSLAIGKKGQNVRWLPRLLGWKIDIKSEEEKRQESGDCHGGAGSRRRSGVGGSSITALRRTLSKKLLEAGVATVEQLGSMTPEELEAIPSIGLAIVEKILVAVMGLLCCSSSKAAREEDIPAEEVAEEIASGSCQRATASSRGR